MALEQDKEELLERMNVLIDKLDDTIEEIKVKNETNAKDNAKEEVKVESDAETEKNTSEKETEVKEEFVSCKCGNKKDKVAKCPMRDDNGEFKCPFKGSQATMCPLRSIGKEEMDVLMNGKKIYITLGREEPPVNESEKYSNVDIFLNILTFFIILVAIVYNLYRISKCFY